VRGRQRERPQRAPARPPERRPRSLCVKVEALRLNRGEPRLKLDEGQRAARGNPGPNESIRRAVACFRQSLPPPCGRRSSHSIYDVAIGGA
jgi:hypothetical protein